MEERVEISMLLDMYGSLLTDKQLEIMNLYYNEDLSLSEISELTNTSRQAIHDILKRCNKLLLEYEKKLNLLSKSSNNQKSNSMILDSIKKLKLLIKDKESLDIILSIEENILKRF